MSTKQLEIVPLKRNGLEITTDETFFAKRDAVLAEASMFVEIESDKQRDAATRVIQDLAEMRRAVERCRKELKEPFLQAGRDIDSKAKLALENVSEEESRLSKLAGNYQAMMDAKARSLAAMSQVSEMEARQAERHMALADAKTPEEVDEINERFSREAAALFVPVPSEIKGRKKVDYEITVTDIHALYRAHPNCVKLEPRISEIKAVIASGAGELLKGVTFKEVTEIKAK